MKNIIAYYYHFANISLHYRNGVYSFEKNQFLYLFQELRRSLNELKQIEQLLQMFPSKYHHIILNRDGQPITMIDQKPYILFQVTVQNKKKQLASLLLEKEELPIETKSFSLLYRMEWTKLWSAKIDYFEYQIKHLEKNYPLLASSIYYYIGLAENAISYVEDANLHERKEKQDYPVISHIRMDAQMSIIDYYHPFSIVLDYKARDVAGYLKSRFFLDDYTEDEIETLLVSLHFSRYGYRLLLGRMLYPSYYFDLYEQIIIGQKKEEEIKKVIKKAESYRDYVKMIYIRINKIIELPKIDWL